MDRLVECFTVIFIFKDHWQFLAFFYELIKPPAEGGIVDVIHGFCYDLGMARYTGDDTFLSVWVTLSINTFDHKYDSIVENQAITRLRTRIML